MTFPAIVNSQNYQSASSASHTVTLPGSIVQGNLLLMLIGFGLARTITGLSGWTALYNSAGRVAALIKVAGASESNPVLSLDGASTLHAQTYQLDTWYGALAGVAAGTIATGNSASPDSSSLAPAWGTDDTLWLSFCAPPNTNVTVYPANYTLGQYGPTGYLAAAARQLNASSDDPGAFTMAASGAWAALTVAVRGFVPVPAQAGHFFGANY